LVNVLEYPKCSTCRNSIKWFENNGIGIKKRHIIDDALNVEEIRKLHRLSGLPIQKFFNASGIKYRELELKNKVKNMNDEERYELLASDGMLIKRPLVYDNFGKLTIGLKTDEYNNNWKS